MQIEIELLVGAIVYSDCKIDAVINVLQRKGITVSSEEIQNETQSAYEKEFELKRERE
ncbi:MAG: hypothetical protein WDA22_01630 [Bacteroidota bacterium]